MTCRLWKFAAAKLLTLSSWHRSCSQRWWWTWGIQHGWERPLFIAMKSLNLLGKSPLPKVKRVKAAEIGRWRRVSSVFAPKLGRLGILQWSLLSPCAWQQFWGIDIKGTRNLPLCLSPKTIPNVHWNHFKPSKSSQHSTFSNQYKKQLNQRDKLVIIM